MDWDFIIAVLTQLGFSHLFTEWIWAYISVKEIKLLLNGSIVGKINPEQGLRQGDPLSPSLFIIVAKTLSCLLLDKEEKCLIKGFKLERHGTVVNHLMFADDIILFGQATLKEAKAFQDCLSTYCQWSGQSINLQKSYVFFSKGVPRERIRAITNYLGMKKMGINASYLGLPLFRSPYRIEDYNHLMDKVLKCVQGWKAKLLSSVGRACLIKSVGSTLANYIASSNNIPISTANKIDRAPKTYGGLRFRSTEATNKAFLMNWAWKILVGDTSLWSKVMATKHIKNQNFLDMDVQATNSMLWKAILQIRPFIHRGICQKIGNGNATSIWFHPWVPGDTLQPQPRRVATEGVSLADSWLWLPEPNGNFIIQSAYRTIKNMDNNAANNNKKSRIMWGAKIHSRLKMLWWKILSNSLPIRGGAAIIFEKIWKERNIINHNGNPSPINVLLHQINTRLWESMETQVTSVGPTIISDKWVPPPEGWCMCNTDVVIGHHCTIGAAVFRNSAEEFLSVHTTKLHYKDPLVGEIASLYWGAKNAIILGHKNIILQCDSAGAISTISCKKWDIHMLNHNIQELVANFHTLAEKLHLWETRWIPRKLNCVAHDVAQWTIRSSQFENIEVANFDSFLPRG
uniref:Reverse transcriptase domain-containing protein n=1 Tax=Cannabis sativa TaxID=3483 RepID=A0A803PI61_CANSA